MGAWLYRYVFRGIGLVFVIGVITMLFLAVNSQMNRPMPPASARDAGNIRTGR